MPANEDGIRIEPPPSPPWARGPSPAATWADAPPLDPPGVLSRSHGFRVIPVSGLSVAPFHPNSGVVVFPRKTPPASRSRRSSGVSSLGDVAGEDLRPAHRAHAPGRLEVLDRIGNAVEGAEPLAAHDRILRRLRLLEGDLRGRGAEAVESGVERLDPRDHRSGQLDRRQPATPDVGREIDRGAEAEILVVHRFVLRRPPPMACPPPRRRRPAPPARPARSRSRRRMPLSPSAARMAAGTGPAVPSPARRSDGRPPAAPRAAR